MHTQPVLKQTNIVHQIPLPYGLYNYLQVLLMCFSHNFIECCYENHTLHPSRNQIALTWSERHASTFSKYFRPA